MRPVTQTLFGSPTGPVEEIGNCFPACLASMLEVDLAEVPHVYQLHAETELALTETLNWLKSRGHTLMAFDYADWVHRYLEGALVLVSGKSPRGNFNHVVIGELTATGWSLVHDPHPSRAGIEGVPTTVEILFETKRLASAIDGAVVAADG